MKNYSCVAKTFFGFENILADELSSLQCEHIKILNRAVSFSCSKRTLYRVNLCSRFAISILVDWQQFHARSDEEFYRRMVNINWDDILSLKKTFMIRSNIARSTVFKNSQFIGLRTKDAIADFFSEKYGQRPNVDTVDPDVKIHVYVNENKVYLSLNSSGESLFKRGYRVAMSQAPINEVLAAGIIELSGWNIDQTFYDPMCGSGTFLIEAAMKAHKIPPGMKRRFGFQNWINYTPELWDMIYKEEVDKIRESSIKIIGSDRDSKVLEMARENISAAFLEDTILLSKKDFFSSDWKKNELPFILINPPYDKRLKKNQIVDFYKKIGDTLKFRYAGTQAWIISSNLEAMKYIGLRPSKKIKLFNGSLECQFAQYKMYRGSKNSKYLNQTDL